MSRLTDYTTYADAHRHFSSAGLWSLFDGDRESLNIAHECIDRYAGSGRVAVRVAHADGRDEVLSFRDLSQWSSRFAHWLASRGVARGDRVAIMLEPSLAFYAALFGAIKRGAIAVPLFTLFGPDGIRLRVEDCAPKLLLTNAEKADTARALDGLDVVVADDQLMTALTAQPSGYETRSAPDDLAVFQYTSGTTRALVEATFRVPVCSMYGTTEVGVILADYPGAADHVAKPGALGKPVPGVRVEVQGADGQPCPPNQIGEIKVWRRGAWFPTKDRGHVDGDGYFYHAGRADDVIISAGWTMSAVEIEAGLLRHPDVREAAVIGVADPVRGQVVKAFVVSPRGGHVGFARELQDFTRTRP